MDVSSSLAFAVVAPGSAGLHSAQVVLSPFPVVTASVFDLLLNSFLPKWQPSLSSSAVTPTTADTGSALAQIKSVTAATHSSCESPILQALNLSKEVGIDSLREMLYLNNICAQ